MSQPLHSRFASSQVSPLSEDKLRRLAPSIFAEDAHASRSDRYAYVPTIDILRGLKEEGFEPFSASQARARDASQRGHAKHMVRLRHVSHLDDQEANEIILLNSHNGSSSYQMMSGVFRFACANGLILGDKDLEIRISHKGDIKDQVLDGANVILERFDLITERRESMKQVELTPDEASAFANAALVLRYADPAKPAPITEAQLLRPRRAMDVGTDLWTTFNRVQENIIRGGQPGRNASGRRATTRAVSGIDQSTAINRALWTLAEEMKRLKS